MALQDFERACACVRAQSANAPQSEKGCFQRCGWLDEGKAQVCLQLQKFVFISFLL